MPGGRRGRGQGWRRAGKGQAQIRRISRFLEPCLLYLLKNHSVHGYELIEGLKQFGFDTEELDPSIVYRVLRELEEEGMTISEWDTSGSGAPRRVYTISEDGLSLLVWWVKELEETQEGINRFLSMINQN